MQQREKPHATGTIRPGVGSKIGYAIQCAVTSTLEEADWAVVDCGQRTKKSECKEHIGMHCTCRIWQPNSSVDKMSRFN